MKKPDPIISSKIKEEFDDITGCDTVSDVERLKNVGELLFDASEIYSTADQLSQIFRKMCVENNITEAYFNEKYKQYAINTLGKFPQSAANNRANTVKMLKHGERLSWKKFLELTTLVLGLKIKDVTIRLYNSSTNKDQVFSLE